MMYSVKGATIYILCEESGKILEKIAVNTNRITFGSYPLNNVRLHTPNTERLHCKIFADSSNSVTIVNYSQSNPVRVNNTRVQSTTDLHDNDKFEVAGCLFLWNFNPANIKAVPKPKKRTIQQCRRKTITLKRVRSSGDIEKQSCAIVPRSVSLMLNAYRKRRTIHSNTVFRQSSLCDANISNNRCEENNLSEHASNALVETSTPTTVNIMRPDLSPAITPLIEKENIVPANIQELITGDLMTKTHTPVSKRRHLACHTPVSHLIDLTTPPAKTRATSSARKALSSKAIQSPRLLDVVNIVTPSPKKISRTPISLRSTTSTPKTTLLKSAIKNSRAHEPSPKKTPLTSGFAKKTPNVKLNTPRSNTPKLAPVSGKSSTPKARKHLMSSLNEKKGVPMYKTDSPVPIISLEESSKHSTPTLTKRQGTAATPKRTVCGTPKGQLLERCNIQQPASVVTSANTDNIGEVECPSVEPIIDVRSIIKKPNRTTQIRSAKYSDITPHESFADGLMPIASIPPEETVIVFQAESSVSTPSNILQDELKCVSDMPSNVNPNRNSCSSAIAPFFSDASQKTRKTMSDFSSRLPASPLRPLSHYKLIQSNLDSIDVSTKDTKAHPAIIVSEDDNDENELLAESGMTQSLQNDSIPTTPELRHSWRHTRKCIGSAFTSLNTSRPQLDLTAEIDESLVLTEDEEAVPENNQLYNLECSNPIPSSDVEQLVLHNASSNNRPASMVPETTTEISSGLMSHSFDNEPPLRDSDDIAECSITEQEKVQEDAVHQEASYSTKIALHLEIPELIFNHFDEDEKEVEAISESKTGDNEMAEITESQADDEEVEEISESQTGDKEVVVISESQIDDKDEEEMFDSQAEDKKVEEMSESQTEGQEVEEISESQTVVKEEEEIPESLIEDKGVEEMSESQLEGQEVEEISVSQSVDKEDSQIDDKEIEEIPESHTDDKEVEEIPESQTVDKEEEEIPEPQIEDKEVEEIAEPRSEDKEVEEISQSQESSYPSDTVLIMESPELHSNFDEKDKEVISESQIDDEEVKEISESQSEDKEDPQTDDKEIEEIPELHTDDKEVEEISESQTVDKEEEELPGSHPDEEKEVVEIAESQIDDKKLEEIPQSQPEEKEVEEMSELQQEMEEIPEPQTDDKEIEEISELQTVDKEVEEMSELQPEDKEIEEIPESQAADKEIEEISESQTDDKEVKDISESQIDGNEVEEMSESHTVDKEEEEIPESQQEMAEIPEPQIDQIPESQSEDKEVEEISESQPEDKEDPQTDTKEVEDISESQTDDNEVEEISEPQQEMREIPEPQTDNKEEEEMSESQPEVKEEEISESQIDDKELEEIPESQPEDKEIEEIPESQAADKEVEEISESQTDGKEEEEISESQPEDKEVKEIPESQTDDKEVEEICEPQQELEEVAEPQTDDKEEEEMLESKTEDKEMEEIPELQAVDKEIEEIPESQTDDKKVEEIPESQSDDKKVHEILESLGEIPGSEVMSDSLSQSSNEEATSRNAENNERSVIESELAYQRATVQATSEKADGNMLQLGTSVLSVDKNDKPVEAISGIEPKQMPTTPKVSKRRLYSKSNYNSETLLTPNNIVESPRAVQVTFSEGYPSLVKTMQQHKNDAENLVRDNRPKRSCRLKITNLSEEFLAGNSPAPKFVKPKPEASEHHDSFAVNEGESGDIQNEKSDTSIIQNSSQTLDGAAMEDSRKDKDVSTGARKGRTQKKVILEESSTVQTPVRKGRNRKPVDTVKETDATKEPLGDTEAIEQEDNQNMDDAEADSLATDDKEEQKDKPQVARKGRALRKIVPQEEPSSVRTPIRKGRGRKVADAVKAIDPSKEPLVEAEGIEQEEPQNMENETELSLRETKQAGTPAEAADSMATDDKEEQKAEPTVSRKGRALRKIAPQEEPSTVRTPVRKGRGRKAADAVKEVDAAGKPLAEAEAIEQKDNQNKDGATELSLQDIKQVSTPAEAESMATDDKEEQKGKPKVARKGRAPRKIALQEEEPSSARTPVRKGRGRKVVDAVKEVDASEKSFGEVGAIEQKDNQKTEDKKELSLRRTKRAAEPADTDSMAADDKEKLNAEPTAARKGRTRKIAALEESSSSGVKTPVRRGRKVARVAEENVAPETPLGETEVSEQHRITTPTPNKTGKRRLVDLRGDEDAQSAADSMATGDKDEKLTDQPTGARKGRAPRKVVILEEPSSIVKTPVRRGRKAAKKAEEIPATETNPLDETAVSEPDLEKPPARKGRRRKAELGENENDHKSDDMNERTKRTRRPQAQEVVPEDINVEATAEKTSTSRTKAKRTAKKNDESVSDNTDVASSAAESPKLEKIPRRTRAKRNC
ncbi:titin-like isoform X2 [Anopheles stephensi]|uniref:titin-like isoform X2 n=1 Tax=Anopheles stephensi TaxID=30069 RepID=UPI001658BE99|nr:titin-like isoform X2 [Anopheles stephensi]